LAELRFYFDESVNLAVSQQLAVAGLDVVSAHSLDHLGDGDPVHLQRAASMGRVLCTCDADFLHLAQQGTAHSGIVFGAMRRTTVGDWVRYLRRLHANLKAEDLEGLVFYVERW